LYLPSDPVTEDEIGGFHETIRLMADCIVAFRERYGLGRAIAAPQVGLQKRIIVINIDRPYTIYNPEFFEKSDKQIENWDEQIWELQDDIAELLQHEFDHLNGILATMRALDEKSFSWRKQKA
jgi:peptide deformylase